MRKYHQQYGQTNDPYRQYRSSHVSPTRSVKSIKKPLKTSRHVFTGHIDLVNNHSNETPTYLKTKAALMTKKLNSQIEQSYSDNQSDFQNGHTMQNQGSEPNVLSFNSSKNLITPRAGNNFNQTTSTLTGNTPRRVMNDNGSGNVYDKHQYRNSYNPMTSLANTHINQRIHDDTKQIFDYDENQAQFDQDVIANNEPVSAPLTQRYQSIQPILDQKVCKISPRGRKSYLSKEHSTKIKKDLNKFCIECQEKDPQWCSVNNGIFICLHCSAFHRGYGVQISFVRSLEMDQLDPIQVKMLELGGNRKFLEFIQMYMIKNDDSDRHSKYCKKACAVYRDKLQECAENDKEFVVDTSWFDELSLTDGHEMVQQYNKQAQLLNIQRRYESQRESSTQQEMQSLGMYITENFMKIPSCIQTMTVRNNYFLPQSGCCRTNSNVQYGNELRLSATNFGQQ